MAKYEKPLFNKIPFKFTPGGGYQKPSFGNVPFNFGKPSYSTSFQPLFEVISVNKRIFQLLLDQIMWDIKIWLRI